MVVPRFPDRDGVITGPAHRMGQHRTLTMVHEAGGDRVAVYDIENEQGTPIYVHAKVVVIDDEVALLGSDNLNRRSWTHDSELSIAVVPSKRGTVLQPPSHETQAALQKVYLDSGYGIRPVVEAILMHPDFHSGPAMVKPPVVYHAGLMRTLGRTIERGDWSWLSDQMGQRLFYPPNVGGWPGGRAWLSGRAVVARANFAATLAGGGLGPGAGPPDLGELALRLGGADRPAEAIARCQKPMPDVQNAPAFWTSVANAYKGNDAVVLDLFNEPFPDIPAGNVDAGWRCYRDGP